jgi:cellulose synthase/poly-beta-1,6-N-acetylglucosamine synthase-like glycosyltransferase
MGWFKDTILTSRFWENAPLDLKMPEVLPSVAVVIPAFNEEKTIEDTIKSVINQNYPKILIFVVDDCSTDRTGEIAATFPNVLVLKPDYNTGSKSRALNYALQFIDEDFFVSVDADTFLHPNAITTTIPHFNDERVGIACGFVSSLNMGSVWERGRAIEYLYAQNVLKTAQDKLNIVLIAAGCFTIVRTSLLKELGGYTERTMAEDMDLTWQIIERGMYVRFVPDALCSVVDPPNRDIFHKQVSRWIHGFLQNIRVRKFDLFNKNPKLGFTAYFYLLWMLFGSFFFPLFALTIINSWPLAFVWFVGVMAGFVWVPAYIQGRKLGISRWKLISSMPSLFVVYYATLYIFMESVVKEFILNKTVTVWHKGH